MKPRPRFFVSGAFAATPCIRATMVVDTDSLETRPLVRLHTVLRDTENKYGGVVSALENRVQHFRQRVRWLSGVTGVIAALMACLGAGQIAGADSAETRVASGMLQLTLAIATVARATYAYEDKLAACETGIAWSMAAVAACVRTRDAYAHAKLDAAGAAAAFADLSLDMVRAAAANADAAIPI